MSERTEAIRMAHARHQPCHPCSVTEGGCSFAHLLREVDEYRAEVVRLHNELHAASKSLHQVEQLCDEADAAGGTDGGGTVCAIHPDRIREAMEW